MLYLQAKYLEVRELPEKPPYPQSCLVSVLVGVEAMTLMARAEVAGALDVLNQLDDVVFEVKAKQVDLTQLGGSGKAYRLSIVRMIAEGSSE